MHRAAVPVISVVVMPVGVGVGELLGGQRQDLLDVAIAEVRIGLQHQGDNAGHDRRGERRALRNRVVSAEHRAVLVLDKARGRGHIRARRGDKNARPRVTERRLADDQRAQVTRGVDRPGGNRKAVVAGGQVVGVAACLPVVAAGHDDGGPQSVAAVVGGIFEGVFEVRVVVEVGDEVRMRGPGVVGDVVPRHLAERVQIETIVVDPMPGDLGVVGHAYCPLAVLRRHDHARHQRGVGGEIPFTALARQIARRGVREPTGVDVRLQIGMPVVEHFLGDGKVAAGLKLADPHVLSGVVFPHRENIGIREIPFVGH